MEVESGKKVKITKIIDEGFLFKKNLSKLTKNLKNPEVAEEIFSKLILPTKEQYEIVKNLQIFSEVTFHSFKRINLPIFFLKFLVFSIIYPFISKSLFHFNYNI